MCNGIPPFNLNGGNMAKKEKSESAIIKNGKNFSTLLTNANLRGLLNEVVLSVVDGKGEIQAIDMTSSVFLSCVEDLGITEDLKIGLNNLPGLIKFFENSEEVQYRFEEDWIILKKHKAQLKCILSPPESVSTSIAEKLKFSDLKKQCTNSIEFTKKMYDDLTYYSSIVSPTSIFIVAEKRKTILHSNEYDEQQFKLVLGKAETDETCKTEILTEHFLKILSILDWSEKATMFFGTDVPTVIKQKENFWSLVPLKS